MTPTRTTPTLDDDFVAQARESDINLSAAVRDALAKSDRAAYQRLPERDVDSWSDAEAWGDE